MPEHKSRIEDVIEADEINIEIGSQKRVKGQTVSTQVKHDNLMLLFGLKKHNESSMITDLVRCILRRVDPNSLSIEFPKVVD